MEKVALGAWAEGGKEKTPHEKFKIKLLISKIKRIPKIYMCIPRI